MEFQRTPPCVEHEITPQQPQLRLLDDREEAKGGRRRLGDSHAGSQRRMLAACLPWQSPNRRIFRPPAAVDLSSAQKSPLPGLSGVSTASLAPRNVMVSPEIPLTLVALMLTGLV